MRSLFRIHFTNLNETAAFHITCRITPICATADSKRRKYGGLMDCSGWIVSRRTRKRNRVQAKFHEMNDLSSAFYIFTYNCIWDILIMLYERSTQIYINGSNCNHNLLLWAILYLLSLLLPHCIHMTFLLLSILVIAYGARWSKGPPKVQSRITSMYFV